jgi:hypothetical protein
VWLFGPPLMDESAPNSNKNLTNSTEAPFSRQRNVTECHFLCLLRYDLHHFFNSNLVNDVASRCAARCNVCIAV